VRSSVSDACCMTDLHAPTQVDTIECATLHGSMSAKYRTIGETWREGRELRLFQLNGGLGPKGRKPWLMKSRIGARQCEHIIDVLQSETGKPRAEASMEPLYADC